MLQQINKENDYLALNHVYDALNQRISGVYYQSVVNKSTSDQTYFEAKKIQNIAATASLVNSPKSDDNNSKTNWLATPIVPEPHLLVVGGGIDARPLVNIAKQLGWTVSLWDPRPANARKEYFPDVDHIIKGEAEVLTFFARQESVNAAILMGHNVSLDAQALKALSATPLQYLALLGPLKRKQQVIIRAEVKEDNLPFVFAGPSGLDIGGTLPESIALSIIAECHASLYGRKALSISQVL
jgi:xanthine dehydrogenase accessory factor